MVLFPSTWWHSHSFYCLLWTNFLQLLLELTKMPDVMLETWNPKEDRKSQKQTTHTKNTLSTVHWSFPALSLLLLPLSPPHRAPHLASIFLRPGAWGESAVSHLRLNYLFCRFRAEHRFRLRGAHWADFLLLWHSRWPGPWCCRPCACRHVFHGRDSGGATMCWPLEEVPWHWNWDDYHQSRQVRTIPLIARFEDQENKLRSCYIFLSIYLR